MTSPRWRVIEKPHGISTHGAHSGDLGVAEWLDLHLGETLHVCSRLDKGTSGVLPLARTPEASAEAEKIHAAGTALKTYHLIVDRKPPSGTWTVSEPIDGEPAETRFFAERSSAGFHLVRAEIHRGRRHQIRRHAAASGLPILGDAEYGGRSFARLCLHCAEVRWPSEEAPWRSTSPQSFASVLKGNSTLITCTHAALERRLGFLAPATNAWRMIHRGELDGLPIAVDRYADQLLVTGFDEETSSREWLERLEPALRLLSEACGATGGVVRTHRRDPHRRSLFADTVTFGAPPAGPIWAREGGLEYEILLNDAQHPGLFLDQRDNRRRIARLAAGKRVANLFAFTASFSAAAVRAGAEVAFSVDLARGSLDRGKRTFARNGLEEGGRGKFIAEDVRDWLARQVRKRERDGAAWRGWDLVVCDPPVFAGGERAFSVEKEWPELAEAVRQILSPGGQALFCNNHQAGDQRRYLGELEDRFDQVQRINPPLDFPVLPGQPEHVRMFWCEARAKD